MEVVEGDKGWCMGSVLLPHGPLPLCCWRNDLSLPTLQHLQPEVSLFFFVFYTFHLGKSSEPMCCWWLVNEIFLFVELPQSWRVSTCMVFTNNFCKYAFIWWLLCLKMILYIFLYSLDIFLNVSKVFTLSNRLFYLPDLLTFKIITSACVMFCWLQ